MRVLKRWQHLTNGRGRTAQLSVRRGAPGDRALPARSDFHYEIWGSKRDLKKSKKEPKEALTPQLMVC